MEGIARLVSWKNQEKMFRNPPKNPHLKKTPKIPNHCQVDRAVRRGHTSGSMVVMATIKDVMTVVVIETTVAMVIIMEIDIPETMTVIDITTTDIDMIGRVMMTGIVMTTDHMEVTRLEGLMTETGTTEIGHMTEVEIIAEMTDPGISSRDTETTGTRVTGSRDMGETSRDTVETGEATTGEEVRTVGAGTEGDRTRIIVEVIIRITEAVTGVDITEIEVSLQTTKSWTRHLNHEQYYSIINKTY